MKYNRAIIITLSIALVSLFFGLAVLNEVKAQLVKSSTNEYKQQQEILAGQIADTLRNNLENVENQLVVMSTMPELKDTNNVDQCNSKLTELLQINQRQLGNLARTDTDGRFVCSANKAIIGQDSARYGSYVHDLINDPTHKPVMGRVSQPAGANSLVIGLHVPVYQEGKFVGSLGSGIYFDRYQDQYLKSIKLGASGHVVLMDDNGDILYHPSPKQNGKNLLSPKILAFFEPQQTMRDLVKHIQANQSGSFEYSVNGTKKVGLYKPIDIPHVTGRHWGIFVTIPIEDLNAAVNEAGINRIFITLVLLFSMTTGLLTFVSLRNSIKAIEVQNMKDEFISLTSHQLRTPATIVKQYLGLLMGGYAKDKKDAANFMKAAYDSNETQLSIIENILSVSKLKAGHLDVQKELVVLQDLINKIIKPINSSTNTNKTKVTVRMPTRPIRINADPTKISMAFDNLISNAIKYTPDKGGKVTITLTRRKDEVIIAVKDNGKGIPKKEIPNLFKRFNRLNHAGASNVPGTGLGLYMAMIIVKLHNGTITVESRENVGSTFNIILPLG